MSPVEYGMNGVVGSMGKPGRDLIIDNACRLVWNRWKYAYIFQITARTDCHFCQQFKFTKKAVGQFKG